MLSPAQVMQTGERRRQQRLGSIIRSHKISLLALRAGRDLSQHGAAAHSGDHQAAQQQGGQKAEDGGPAVRPPDGVNPPDGFDLEAVERQEDGQFCVFKELSLEGIEKLPVQQCVHKVDRHCYFSYVTQYTPTTEDVCSENYAKKCYIEYSQRSVAETVEKCYHPMERVCDPPRPGQLPNEVCQTQYETSCVTRFTETAVVEEEVECGEAECELPGYSGQQCPDTSQQQCQTVQKTVQKKLPETTSCAPDNCDYVAGEQVCHNQTIDITVDSPEEVCDLQPQKMCKQVYRLVPKLSPQEICEDIPREVCYTTLKNPRKVSTPLLTKWCFTPDPAEPADPSLDPVPDQASSPSGDRDTENRREQAEYSRTPVQQEAGRYRQDQQTDLQSLNQDQVFRQEDEFVPNFQQDQNFINSPAENYEQSLFQQNQNFRPNNDFPQAFPNDKIFGQNQNFISDRDYDQNQDFSGDFNQNLPPEQIFNPNFRQDFSPTFSQNPAEDEADFDYDYYGSQSSSQSNVYNSNSGFSAPRTQSRNQFKASDQQSQYRPPSRKSSPHRSNFNFASDVNQEQRSAFSQPPREFSQPDRVLPDDDDRNGGGGGEPAARPAPPRTLFPPPPQYGQRTRARRRPRHTLPGPASR